MCVCMWAYARCAFNDDGRTGEMRWEQKEYTYMHHNLFYIALQICFKHSLLLCSRGKLLHYTETHTNFLTVQKKRCLVYSLNWANSSAAVFGPLVSLAFSYLYIATRYFRLYSFLWAYMFYDAKRITYCSFKIFMC